MQHYVGHKLICNKALINLLMKMVKQNLNLKKKIGSEYSARKKNLTHSWAHSCGRSSAQLAELMVRHASEQQLKTQFKSKLLIR